jgi:hypothetical protein
VVASRVVLSYSSDAHGGTVVMVWMANSPTIARAQPRYEPRGVGETLYVGV